MDTIAAPITAAGRAAVHVVRVSGPETRAAAHSLLPKAAQVCAAPQRLSVTPICAADKAVIDIGMAAFFPGPNSFTGEDVLELHLHGSPLVLRQVLDALIQQGVRLARPGEFSERAFLNGRMDLSQVEAVADLIASETEAQARVAKEQLSGTVSRATDAVGEPLRDLLAEIEAYIDFPDEDIQPMRREDWSAVVGQADRAIQTMLDSYGKGRLYREGASVVLAGTPNVGKSSILNRLAGEERAIVTEIPGTTRDSIEVQIAVRGLAVRLWDTAGLEPGTRSLDTVERLGIERTKQRIEQADLLLLVFDPSADVQAQLDELNQVGIRPERSIVVINKSDLEFAALSPELVSGCAQVAISAQTGQGIETLLDAIGEKLAGEEIPRGSVIISNRRHFECFVRAQQALLRAREALLIEAPAEIVSLELRDALGALSDIIGVTATEETLGRIFSKFCIGK